MRPESSPGKKIGKACSGYASACLTNLLKAKKKSKNKKNKKNDISLFNQKQTLHTFWDTTNFWAKYKNDSLIGKITKGNIDFHVPMPNGNTTIKKGKLIQDYNDFRIVWNQICKDFSSPETKIRKPNSSELAQYWSIIFFDIEEPVFIIENEGVNLIIDLDKNYKLMFIEILN